MNKLIERLYDELYSPKVNPEDLINNAMLPNYTSVNFEANQTGLLVITKCILENDKEAEYKYQFDKDKRLLILLSNINEETEVIYNRDQEVALKYKELKRHLDYRGLAG